MIQKPQHFDLEELVCPHVYYKFGEMSWQFLDQKQLILMDWVREQLGPMFVNNWLHEYLEHPFVKFIKESIRDHKPIFVFDEPKAPPALFSQRGLRCNICNLNYNKTIAGIIYLSPHFLGKGDDFDVMGMSAEEVRQWLIKNKSKIPYNIRLEKGVSWVHMDCEDSGEKVQLVNP